MLLADASFDSGEMYEEAEGRFVPIIRFKGGGEVKDPRRKGC